MTNFNTLATDSPASVTSLRNLMVGAKLAKPADASTGSALNLQCLDSQGALLRFFTTGGDLAINPTALFNAGAHFHSIASVLVSGQPNGLTGDAWDVVEPSTSFSYMIAAWADTAGPTVLWRANQYAGQTGYLDAHPMMCMSGAGNVVNCVENDGAVSMGRGATRASLDTRIQRIIGGWVGIDTRPGPFTANLGNGGLAVKTIGCTLGGGLQVAEGTDACSGLATLAAGSVVVNTAKVTANSRIQVTPQSPGGTPGWLRISARTAGTSFTITSSSGTDTSAVAWMIVEPFILPTNPLGPELVFNGTFTTDITGWQAYPGQGPTTIAWDSASGGRLHFANSSSATRGLGGQDGSLHAFATTAGTSYQLQATLVCVSGLTCGLSFVRSDYGPAEFAANVANNQGPGTYTINVIEVSSYTGNVVVQLDFGNLVGDCYLDNVSVRQLL